ncbi:MAG: hypothetical protein LBE03_00560 [Candidatus Nomurabacteria bacterium]|nr:hypothetical protein [Candidatus Nomurabacteria bacterium]
MITARIISVGKDKILVGGEIPEGHLVEMWMPIKKCLAKKISMIINYREPNTLVITFMVDFRFITEEEQLLAKASALMLNELKNYFSQQNPIT